MNLLPRCVIALAALGSITCTQAAEPRKNVLTTLVDATEVQVKSVVLPQSSTSSLVMTPCSGCAPRTYPQTAQTQYFINKDTVTLQALRTAVFDKPELVLTVAHDVKTGNLVSITADLPTQAASPARR